MAEAFHIEPNVLFEDYTRAQVDLMLHTHNWSMPQYDNDGEKTAPVAGAKGKTLNTPGDNRSAANALMGLGPL